MKAPDSFLTMFLFCKVYEGTSFDSQDLHTVDKPNPAGEEKVCEKLLIMQPEYQPTNADFKSI